MQVNLIAVGTRMPDWIDKGFHEYARRLPRECRLRLVEIPSGYRGKGADPARSLQSEGERMLTAVPKDSDVLALDVSGQQLSTEELAQRLAGWLQSARDVALLVGGPDGLAPAASARANTSWSLSRLTLPHMLVRIVVVEQIYRSMSILKGHPYHR